jgi:signal transduction histidine kinase/CheY-like chemotaxis protein/HPt (histidine-containing phosphotransfer) domain-containing protein
MTVFDLLALGFGVAALAAALLLIRVLQTQRQARRLLEQSVDERTRDLAEANDRLTRASRAKTEFLANMSHEIRTPLAAILGFTDLLDDDRLDASERRKITGILRRNGEHLLGILSNILDIAKIEAGKLTIEAMSCSPRDIAEEVCSLLRNQAEGKGLKLLLRIEAAAIPRRIESDPTRIRQILVNLVGNAIKFTARGSVTLALGLDMRSSGPWLRFEVRDSGIGLSAENMQRIFAEFEQADASTTRRFGGTGLGLAICRRLSEVLGGEISVSSVLNEGATFRLQLPIKESADATHDINQTTIVAPRGVPPPRGLRILVADDSSDIQMLMTRFLADIDARVALASDGRQAVTMVLAAEREARPFDLVLMDLHMPELDGAEAVRELRAAGVDRPIIALTASAYLEDRDRCTEAGYNDFLTKPIDRGQLVQRIATVCRDRGTPIAEVRTADADGGASSLVVAPAPATFDSARLLELVGGDQTAQQAVIALFQKDASPLARAVETSAAHGDAAAVRAAAHKLKGMLATIGAADVAQLAGALESAARANDREQFGPLSARLTTEVERIRAEMARQGRSAA